MARGSQPAQTGADTANRVSGSLANHSEALYSTLAPQLASEAAHPAGFAPADVAKMNTAAQESAGGGTASAVGQGGLLAARTRNAGGADAAIQESAREAGREVSRGALGTQIMNAQEKTRQRQNALAEEGGLYGTTVGGTNQALGEVAGNVNANTNAANQSWDWAKYLLDPALTAASNSKHY